eukprot:2336375-Pyramimonas_sp.AAC.1
MLTNSPVTPTKLITKTTYSTLRLNAFVLLMGKMGAVVHFSARVYDVSIETRRRNSNAARRARTPMHVAM